MKKIFVINGIPGTGKTFFGQLVGKELNGMGINFLHTSSIDLVKRVLLPEDGWNTEIEDLQDRDVLKRLKGKVTDKDWDGVTKDDYWRGVMSNLKSEIINEYPQLISHSIIRKIDVISEPYVTFVDIREPESIKHFIWTCSVHESLREVKVKTVLVDSDAGKMADNPSDRSVFSMEYDYVIRNDRVKFEGTWEPLGEEALARKARQFIELAIIEHRNRPEII